MSSVFNNHTVFSLKEVMNSIRKTLAGRYTSAYWIKAEMNKLNYYTYSGHCYPDLVEKTEGKIVAQTRALIWKSDFLAINNKFLKILKEPLREGSHILFRGQIQFDPVHGLSLRILDIDPAYSLGELEREKMETIARMEQEGIIHRNKSLELPLLPQRIAVISVESSKGYADFRKIIEHNPEGFRFFHFLFPAQLQGEQAVSTIITQLTHIRRCMDLFDIVVIVRGGGGEVGLSAFNHYELAKAIALFPLPVLTGIGHATNETVAEMVAYKNAITPTEIGHMLIERFREYATMLQKIQSRIIQFAERKTREDRIQLSQLELFLKSAALKETAKHRTAQSTAVQALIKGGRYIIREHGQNLLNQQCHLERIIQSYIQSEKDNLDRLGRHLSIMDPKQILKRGFSITRLHGKIIRDAAALSEGMEIESTFWKGSLISKVRSRKKP